MNRVVGSAVLSLLVVAGPAFFDEVGLRGLEGAAFAQPSDPVTEVARQRYQEGVKAYEGGKYEDARAAFLQAYALKRVPAVLLNLGQSELRTSPPRYEDAGNHLQQFLREHTGATPDERAAAEKGIAEVKKKCGTVSVSVDAAGADIAIDGTVVAKSPLTDPIFVKPGKHAVTATAGGKSANDAFDAQVGSNKLVILTLGAAAPPVVPVPVPPVGPAPPLSPPLPPDANTNPPPVVPPMNEGPANPPPSNDTSQQSFMQRNWKKPLFVTGVIVGGVGFLDGVIFSIVAASASSTTNSAADSIRAHIVSTHATGLQPCAPDGSTAPDAPGYANACSTLRSDISTFHTDVAIAATGWVFFGIGAITAVTVAAIDSKPKQDASLSSMGQLKVTPIVSPRFNGLSVSGSF